MKGMQMNAQKDYTIRNAKVIHQKEYKRNTQKRIQTDYERNANECTKRLHNKECQRNTSEGIQKEYTKKNANRIWKECKWMHKKVTQ